MAKIKVMAKFFGQKWPESFADHTYKNNLLQLFIKGGIQ